MEKQPEEATGKNICIQNTKDASFFLNCGPKKNCPIGGMSRRLSFPEKNKSLKKAFVIIILLFSIISCNKKEEKVATKITKPKTKKIEFTYDDITFEYDEKEVEAEEDMPIFTIGFSTERGDIPEKILKHLSRLTSRFKNMGNYWVYEEAILDAAPLYMIHKNGLFIFTNDIDLAKNYSSGYGKKALSKAKAKRARKSGFMYSYIDWDNTISHFPRDFFNAEQNDMIDAMRGKTGKMELTSSKTTKEKTSFKLVYHFDGAKDSPGKHLLDLINTLYVVSR